MLFKKFFLFKCPHRWCAAYSSISNYFHSVTIPASFRNLLVFLKIYALASWFERMFNRNYLTQGWMQQTLKSHQEVIVVLTVSIQVNVHKLKHTNRCLVFWGLSSGLQWQAHPSSRTVTMVPSWVDWMLTIGIPWLKEFMVAGKMKATWLLRLAVSSCPLYCCSMYVQNSPCITLCCVLEMPVFFCILLLLLHLYQFFMELFLAFSLLT